MDLAEELEVPLARLSEATRARLAAVLEPGLPATNPLDAWGTGNGPTRSSPPASARCWTTPTPARWPSPLT
jgi:hypothetical protein